MLAMLEDGDLALSQSERTQLILQHIRDEVSNTLEHVLRSFPGLANLQVLSPDFHSATALSRSDIDVRNPNERKVIESALDFAFLFQSAQTQQPMAVSNVFSIPNSKTEFYRNLFLAHAGVLFYGNMQSLISAGAVNSRGDNLPWDPDSYMHIPVGLFDKVPPYFMPEGYEFPEVMVMNVDETSYMLSRKLKDIAIDYLIHAAQGFVYTSTALHIIDIKSFFDALTAFTYQQGTPIVSRDRVLFLLENFLNLDDGNMQTFKGIDRLGYMDVSYDEIFFALASLGIN